MSRSLRLEVLFNAVDRISGPIRTIIGGSQALTDSFKNTKNQLKDLEAQQRKITGFRQLTEQSQRTARAMAENQQRIQQLRESLRLNPASQEAVQALSRAEAAHRRLTNAHRSQRTVLTSMVQGLNRAGISVDRLNDEESDLRNRIHLTTMEMNRQREALDRHAESQRRYERMQQRMAKANEMAKKGLMIAGAGAAALAVPVKIAIDYESAMADVAKVVDGLKDEAGKITPAYTAMSNQILEMTTRLPMAAKDIAAIVAAGAQSGIAKNELIGFAESAVKMGVAFDITADQAGQSMAEMRAAFRMNQPEVVALADKINLLGNTNNQNAPKIMEVVQRIGALGEVGGFAASSVAAMAASLTAVEPEVAATGIKNMILALTKGESATKGQSAAFKKLGLDSVQVSKDMQKNAEATVAKVIEGIQKLEKHEQVAITNELFGSEALPIVMQYSQGLELLRTNLDAVSNASKYAGSMEAEYASRAATTANNIQLAKNAMAALGITIGNVLLPGVNSMIGSFNTVMSKVQAWAQANPVLAGTLTKIAVGAIAIVGGLSALSIGAIAIFGPMMMVAKGFSVVTGALNVMRIALLANPIMLIIAGIALAAFLIYKNWGAISGFFSNLWANVKTSFSNGISAIVSKLGIWKVNIVLIFNNIMNWIKSLPAKFMNFGAMIIDGLKNGILSKVNAVKDAITGAVSGVIDKAKGILGIHSPSRVFMGIGGYTMQGMANGIANANGLPIAATSTATQGVVNTAAQTKPVKPINIGRSNPRSYISQDTIQVTIQVKDGSVVKGTAEAMRQELQRVAEEQQMKKRKFLTDTE